MSAIGAGNGGGAPPTPVASQKAVLLSLKETVMEIYAIPRVCNMNPNEALNRLSQQDTNIAEKAYSESIKGSKKLDYQDHQIVFPSRATIVQKDNVPVVNPTTPGSSPIVNPMNPVPPTTTGPADPTIPLPPATTGPTNPGSSSGGAWCIANPTASPTALQVALDYACGYGGTDCTALQPNAPCFEPNTVADHASYAFNDYYQKNPVPTSCVFGGAAQLSYTDPSHGNCHFASPTSTPMMPPPTPTIPTPTPPSPTMPTSPDTPIGGNGDDTDPTDNDYGAEPTGSPSSAQMVSSDLVLLITTSLLLFMATLF